MTEASRFSFSCDEERWAARLDYKKGRKLGGTETEEDKSTIVMAMTRRWWLFKPPHDINRG